MADTKQPELSLERFGALVEAYGADFERFPLHERSAAKALLLRSSEAQRLLSAAQAFDGILAAARENLATPELEGRLDGIPLRFAQERARGRLLPFRSRQQTVLAAAAAVLLGLLGGRYVPDEALELGATTDAAQSASVDSASSDATEQTDIAALTFADDLFDDLTPQEGGSL
jgi:hypothetical protein